MNEKFEMDISLDLAEKFEIALKLNGDNRKDVVEKLLMQYISTSFSRMSQEYNPRNKYEENKINPDSGKANMRIPKWALKPRQNNHKIIKAYLLLLYDKGIVKLEDLESRCSNSDIFPDTYVRDFRGNFAQMKIDTPKSYGKVFEVEDGKVTIWSEIETVLHEYESYFQ